MKTQRRNMIKVVVAILFLIIMTIAALVISIKQPASAGSKMEPDINNPFIVFAPGFATLLQWGY
jgi:hypothetical protein